MIGVTGIGSWPGGDGDVEEAQRAVRDLLTDLPDGVAGLPYLPELPGRGPGADMIGRTAALLVGLDVELTAHGWSLAGAAGRDARRAASLWSRDLDALAEVFHGYEGPLKTQLVGPWTLAASLLLPRGERVVSDPGAVRDLAQSLAEGVTAHVDRLRSLLPGVDVVLQLDEPSLPEVLAGRLPSASGLRRLRAPDESIARSVLADLVSVARAAVRAGADSAAPATRPFGEVAIHCCARPPLPTLLAAAPDAVAVDVARVRPHQWEPLAEALDAGTRLWAGAEAGVDPAERVGEELTRVGLPHAEGLVLTPACGLAGVDPATARVRHRQIVHMAQDALDRR